MKLTRGQLEEKAWSRTHADYKGTGKNGVKEMLYLNPDTGGTELWPVTLIPSTYLLRKGEEVNTVNCYFCGKEVLDRDSLPADEFNNGDGGSVCPPCNDLQEEVTS